MAHTHLCLSQRLYQPATYNTKQNSLKHIPYPRAYTQFPQNKLFNTTTPPPHHPHCNNTLICFTRCPCSVLPQPNQQTIKSNAFHCSLYQGDLQTASRPNEKANKAKKRIRITTFTFETKSTNSLVASDNSTRKFPYLYEGYHQQHQIKTRN